MRHPFDRHVNDRELNALVPSPSEIGQAPHKLSPAAVREAERHVERCGYCSRKVAQYRQLADLLSHVAVSEAAPPGVSCPTEEDVDWVEVAAGLWPEWKAKQLIMHAARCGHCGPLLRAAISMSDDPTPQEEALLAKLKTPLRPMASARPEATPPRAEPQPIWRRFLQWKMLVPAAALILMVAVFTAMPRSSPSPLSGLEYARFAANTHQQYAEGSLALDLRSNSQQSLNEWLRAKLTLALALPSSPAAPGEERPYRLEGARLLQVGGKTAAYIAYRMQTGPVSLMIAPDSVAVASGGIEVKFKKVSFHYGMVEGYKVVTWSLHGLTYALVSQEGNGTQASCMVCHSAMRDRDLGHTPTPLAAVQNAVAPLLQ